MSQPLQLLSLALTLCACGAPQPEGIVHSPCGLVRLAPLADTTEAERQSIGEAIGLWHGAGVTSLLLGDGDEAVPLRFAEAPALFHGVYEPSSGLISVNRQLAGTARTVTIAHELGHAIGLAHVPASERRSVMNPGNLVVLPTAEDVEALRQRWGCVL